MSRTQRTVVVTSLLALASLLSLTAPASAVTRSEVLARAKAYTYHLWRSTAANVVGSCGAPYKSLFQPGDYMGLSYNWGGYQTLADFDKRIASGNGAGAQQPDGVLSCTAGVDCSGFVSMCWRVGHFTTSSLDQTSAAIAANALIAGDVMNQAGYHVAMFSHLLGNGEPFFYEAVGYNVHANPFGGWSYVSGYTPRRLNGIAGTSAATVEGSATDPIVITSFPYSDSRDTKQSLSSVIDRCAIAPAANESGPEYIYKVSFTQPGSLTVAVTDDSTADIDVHLFSSLNANDCVARHDNTFTQAVDCGTYYIVADSFTSASGAQSGAYNLMATFVPSGAACGAGPASYSPQGKLGDACGYPSKPNLPFCNPTTGANTCIYSTQGAGTSFCSKPCKTNTDCGDLAPGCCEDFGKGEFYCVTNALCGSGGVVNPNPTPTAETDAGDQPADGPLGAADPDGGVASSPSTEMGGCAMARRPQPALLVPVLMLLAALVMRRRLT